jgi:hypothetical protein
MFDEDLFDTSHLEIMPCPLSYEPARLVPKTSPGFHCEPEPESCRVSPNLLEPPPIGSAQE